MITFSTRNSFHLFFAILFCKTFQQFLHCYDYMSGHSIFKFFNHKIFFRPIWNVTFCENVFIFRYFNMTTSFKFKIFFVISFIKVSLCAWPYMNRFHFNSGKRSIVVFIKKRTLRSETIFGYWKSFKNDEKCFLFHLKSSFCSQDISIFFLTFWSCTKTA